MPSLKQITCHVERSDSDLPLHEYQTIYADGFVETYVAVPSVSTTFSVHLCSHGYIAPGLAMFVYMDGEYQCNRNRSNLKTPNEARTWKQTEVDFKVRQKEEPMPDGSFCGKQWKFDSLRTARQLTPHDAQYFGTIEVVVLRCYPTQPSRNPTPSKFVAESTPLAHHQEYTSPFVTDADTSSSSSSDNESNNSESMVPVMPGTFDGTADYAEKSSMSFSQSSNHEKIQPRRSSYTRGDHGHANTAQSRVSSGAPIHYDQLDGSSGPQDWENVIVPDRVVPESNWENWVVPESNSQKHDNSKNQRKKGHRNSGGNESNGRFSTSNRSNNSAADNAADQTSPNSVWIQTQQPSGQAAPAVVINVSHGTPQPANFSSPTRHNPAQTDPINGHLNGTNQSPEGSNHSKASTQSNKSQDWNFQNYDQTNDNTAQDNITHQWHNPLSQGKSDGFQWDTVEDTSNPNREHGVSNNKNDNYPWENNIVGSQPVESSSMGAQNTAYHVAKNAEFQNQQAPNANSSTSAHRIPQSQVPQQPSSHASYKPPVPNPNWRNDAPNSQYSGIRNNDAAQHISPQQWTQNVVEPNNRAPGLPPSAASHIYGPNLPMFIAPRPRPHWYIWKQPRISSSILKDEVPRVELAEPIKHVPSEIAQSNKMSHQVYLSQAAEYVHKRASPKYMDDFSRPYAVFIFKYRSKAILEQILNIPIMEPEAQEKERLRELSKEELIEQLLKAKIYDDNNLSGSVSSHTAKPGKPAYISRDAAAAADGGRLASQNLSHPPSRAVQSSDIASTNPEHHWGRGTPMLNAIPPHPEAKVASWLGSGGGGGSGHGGGGEAGSGHGGGGGAGSGHGGGHGSGSGQINQNHGTPKNGSVRNGSGNSGSGNQGNQNGAPPNWNIFGTAGAWGAANEGQQTVQQTAEKGHQGTQNGAPDSWNMHGTAGAWEPANGGQQTGPQTAVDAHGENGGGDGEVPGQW